MEVISNVDAQRSAVRSIAWLGGRRGSQQRRDPGDSGRKERSLASPTWNQNSGKKRAKTRARGARSHEPEHRNQNRALASETLSASHEPASAQTAKSRRRSLHRLVRPSGHEKLRRHDRMNPETHLLCNNERVAKSRRPAPVDHLNTLASQRVDRVARRLLHASFRV